MNPLNDITFTTAGLSENDREKLQSVLVLAEIRLSSSWSLHDSPDAADVVICRAVDELQPGDMRPVIVYREPSQPEWCVDKHERPLFELRVDSSGMPHFSELVTVFKQIELQLLNVSVANSGPQVLVTDIPLLTPVADLDENGFEDMDLEGVLPTSTEVVKSADPAEDKHIQALSKPEPKAVTPPCLEQLALYLQRSAGDAPYHKILLQSGDVILLDFRSGRFHCNRSLEAFLQEPADNRASYISTLSQQEFKSELSKQDCSEQPIASLQWFLALYSGVEGLHAVSEDEAYCLSAWPDSQLPGLRQEHFKLAAFMRDKKETIKEIAHKTGIPVATIRAFVEACHYQGLVKQDKEQKNVDVQGAERPKGFWRQILRSIKR